MSRRHTAAGLALIAGPLLLLAATVVSPAMRTDNAAQLAIVAQHPERQYAAAVIALVALAVLVPAVLGLKDLLAGAPRVGGLGAALAVAGLVATACSTGLGLLEWQMVERHLDRGQMVALLDQLEGAPGMAVVFFAGALVPAGLTVLVGALAHARIVPAWTAALAIAGALALGLGFTLNVLTVAIAGSAAMAAGLTPVGGLALRGPGAAGTRGVPRLRRLSERSA